MLDLIRDGPANGCVLVPAVFGAVAAAMSAHSLDNLSPLIPLVVLWIHNARGMYVDIILSLSRLLQFDTHVGKLNSRMGTLREPFTCKAPLTTLEKLDHNVRQDVPWHWVDSSNIH